MSRNRNAESGDLTKEEGSSSAVVAQLRSFQQHFWVSSSPYFCTTLILPHVEQATIMAKLFDADGALFNELQIGFAEGKTGLLDLEPCMAGCKFESGLKHARLEISSHKPITALARFHTRDWAVVTREAVPCSALRKFLTPIYPQGERSAIVTVLNRLETDVEIRARLFLGNRSPELTWRVPARGARFIDSRLEFKEVLEQSKDLNIGYLRLSVVGDEEVFVHGLEVVESAKQPRYFSILS